MLSSWEPCERTKPVLELHSVKKTWKPPSDTEDCVLAFISPLPTTSHRAQMFQGHANDNRGVSASVWDIYGHLLQHSIGSEEHCNGLCYYAGCENKTADSHLLCVRIADKVPCLPFKSNYIQLCETDCSWLWHTITSKALPFTLINACQTSFTNYSVRLFTKG